MIESVQTVLGPVQTGGLGRILPHEHIASVHGRWGRQQQTPSVAWEQQVLEHYTPLLARLRQKHGCGALVEVSPSWGFRQGRDLEVWGELSRRSGMRIVVATGYYVGAVRPADFGARSLASLADGMIAEASEGIAGTGVRAGIIKIAVAGMTADDRKLVRAAAVAQQATGLSITTHTCTPQDRRAVLDLLEGAAVPPERIVLGHADTNATLPELLSLVQRGCNVLLTIWGITAPDTIGWQLPTLPRYHSPGLAAGLVAEGFEDRVLASIDYSAGFEEAGFVPDLYRVEERTYLYLFTHALAALRTMGVPAEAVERIVGDNPRRMLELQA